MDTGFHPLVIMRTGKQTKASSPIKIGDYNWFGSKSVSYTHLLLTDEDQNLMIHHLGIEQRSNGGHQPLLEIDAEKLLVVLHMYAGSQTGNRVSSTVPSRQPLQIG